MAHTLGTIMLTTEQTRKLISMKNRATLYELAAIKGNRQILIAYSHSRSRMGLLAAVRKRGPEVIMALELTDTDLLEFSKPVRDFSILATRNNARIGEWAVGFTGRTQHDAIVQGELEYVGDVAAGMVEGKVETK